MIKILNGKSHQKIAKKNVIENPSKLFCMFLPFVSICSTSSTSPLLSRSASSELAEAELALEQAQAAEAEAERVEEEPKWADGDGVVGMGCF